MPWDSAKKFIFLFQSGWLLYKNTTLILGCVLVIYSYVLKFLTSFWQRTGEVSQESLEGQHKVLFVTIWNPGQKETGGFGYITLAVPNK